MKEPSQDFRRQMIERTNKDYLTFRNPQWMDHYKREEWSRAIDDIKVFIKEDASPGVPLALIGNTNGVVLKALGCEFNDLVLDRIEALLRIDLEELDSMGSKEIVDKNLMDPVRCFVKTEPHKKEKVIEGRMRLIASVSLVDKVIEMLLHRVLHKLEIANWRKLPSKPGIGFSKEMNDDVYDFVFTKKQVRPQAYTDVSGWDWSVKEYMIRDCAEGVVGLCENPSAIWKHLVRAEAIKESRTIYQFSDGTMVQLKYKGVVNSGKYKTSRGNSWMRVYLAHMIGAEDVCAAGDDSVESYVDNAVEKYARMGFRIKDYQRVEKGFEFCSRWYQENFSFPLNGDKMLMNLLHSNITSDEQFEMSMLQFTDMMESHPDFPAYTQLLESIGFVTALGRRGPKDHQDGGNFTTETATPAFRETDTESSEQSSQSSERCRSHAAASDCYSPTPAGSSNSRSVYH